MMVFPQDTGKLADHARALASRGYSKSSSGVYTVREELIHRDALGVEILKHGAAINLPLFFDDFCPTIPFLDKIGIVEAFRWFGGRESTTHVLRFDDGTLGLLRADQGHWRQPRWPYAFVTPPWWRQFDEDEHHEILPFGFVPMNYMSAYGHGSVLKTNLDSFLSYMCDHFRDLDHAYPITQVPRVAGKEGFLFLPDGTPFLFDPGEVTEDVARETAQEIHGLDGTEQRYRFENDTAAFDLLLELGFEQTPFTYMSRLQTKMEQFFPIPAKLEAAIAQRPAPVVNQALKFDR